ncbi:MAG TPA: SusD/RagB family nutrient-binding outer membrane lipoprotein [Ferruginibacter sp.]|jgi:hypothetical protein|nr:SusD/RagB family nutrient-binding outer membrane lipoprotein [Ferruginibacter sp.]
MIKRIIYYSVLLLATIGLGSCKKFLDTNTDPSNPTTVSVQQLLPTAESSLAGSLGISGSSAIGVSGFGQVLGVYVHQLTTREDPDQYGAPGSDFYLNDSWNTIYGGTETQTNGGVTYYQDVLQNLQVIITNATAQGNLKYRGIAKILKAYTYSEMVDLFGNVPYSQALQLQQGITNPKFDSGSVIYPQLFLMIDSGITDLQNTTALNPITPGADDIIYGGNVLNWVRAANTIKLKMLTQERLITNVTADVNALLTADTLISATDQSFILHYGTLGSSDNRNPGYADYYNSQKTNYISPWFYSILKGYDPRLFTGIKDPRVPYYFYNQSGPSTVTSNKTEYRDSGFISILFGTIGPNSAFLQDANQTLLGIYPVGGKYDQGDALPVTASSGTGAAPYRFLTYADVLYLEAELMEAGVIAGNPRTELQAAMTESFNQVDFVVGLDAPSQTVPKIVGSGPDTVYINNIMNYYDANPSQQMEIIMTEKWISAFGDCVDQYTDYRRTKFPVLFNPNDPTVCPGGFYQPPVNGDPTTPGPQAAVPVQLTRNYPLTLPFGQDELNANQNAPPQKTDPSTYKVFWLP